MGSESPEGQEPQPKEVTITRGAYLVDRLKSIFRRDKDNNLIVASKVKVTPEGAAKLKNVTLIGSRLEIDASDNPPQDEK